jgi:1,4-dihydroxy-2-naphthoate octaprenyltransferase
VSGSVTDGNFSWLTLVRSARVPFLALAPVCVLLGVGTAVHAGAPVDPRDAWLVLLGAVAAQVSVNTFNEYFDFRSGLDALTVRTPFSGGSGALIENPQAALAVLWLAASTLAVTVLVGLYFVLLRGWWLLPLGLAGVLLVVLYTQWLTRRPLLCLLAPGLGFGPLMVGGTHFALTGVYSGPAFFVSLVPLFLTSNLLLLNQLPDISADRSVGRRHLPIAYGESRSVAVFGLFALAAAATLLAAIQLGYLPRLGYIGLVPLTAALAAWEGARRHAAEPRHLPGYLGLNVVAALLTPLLLGVALMAG